jgi:tRNA (mo5U34)-methyltransferase
MSDLLCRKALYQWLKSEGKSDWADEVRSLCESRYTADAHGLMSDWCNAWQSLPKFNDVVFDASQSAVRIDSASRHRVDESMRELLMKFHPWRKGPFEIFGHFIDTEWRSDWKWDRLARYVDFADKAVLDVGCGSGYYGWRMLAAEAKFVLGCEPLQLYNMQFEVIRRYATQRDRHFVVPLMDTDLPDRLWLFDITMSMGVLYHRTSPIDHLKKLHQTLKPGGTLLIETLIVDDGSDVLIPEDRYAKMRNVWFIPSIKMLELWLRRSGYRDIQVIDVSATTTQEQRSTPWMTYDSLASFLDASDPTKTIEGYPAPVRAMLTAKRD